MTDDWCRARALCAARGLQERRSGDGRSIDAFRTAPAQGVGESRQDDRSRVVKPQAKAGLARECHDREQAAAARHAGFFIVAGRRRGAVMVVVMGAAVRVDVNLAVIVDANVTFDQAMRDARAGGESKRGRGRENAKRVERGEDDRRFDAKSFGRDR